MNKTSSNILLLISRKLALFSPFVFPLYLLRFKIIGIPFTVLEIFCYILFGIWILSVFLQKKTFQWNKLLSKYWFSAFLLIIGATIGVLISPHYIILPLGVELDAQSVALGVWKGWILAPILYFVVITQVFSCKKDVDILLRNFVYSAALVSLVSYLFGIFGTGITYDFRLNGFFESANYLSLYLVPAVLLNIYFVLQRKKPLRAYYYIDLIALITIIHAIFFTKSYAAILAIFGALGMTILYFVLFKAKQRRKFIIALIVLFVTFITVILTQINSPKFKQFLDFENRSSTSVRLEIYTVSLDLIKENSLAGIGLGLFQARYQNNATEILGHHPMEWNMPHPHNIFLAFWLNTGIIGLFAFIFLLILAHRKITYPLFALWGIIIHGMFDVPFWKNDLAMIFWLIIGSILILQLRKFKK